MGGGVPGQGFCHLVLGCPGGFGEDLKEDSKGTMWFPPPEGALLKVLCVSQMQGSNQGPQALWTAASD